MEGWTEPDRVFLPQSLWGAIFRTISPSYGQTLCRARNDWSSCYTPYVSPCICNTAFRGRSGHSFYPKNVRPRFHYDNADLCGSGVKKADGNIKDEASEKSYEYIGGGSDWKDC